MGKKNNKNNVTAGKPKINGAIFRAPVGTPYPTPAAETPLAYAAAATEELDSAFECLGYVSSDGIKNNNSKTSAQIRAWGGQIVLAPMTEHTDTFAGTFIESLNESVQKAVNGDDNVSGSMALGGMAVAIDSTDDIEHVYVIDMLITGGAKRRIVIPYGKISEVGEITYKDDTAVGYPLTIMCLPNPVDEKNHYEYVAPKPTITLDKSTATVAVSGTTAIAATVIPSGATVTWGSSNTSIATVAAGTVTGVAAGKATITATFGGTTAACEVTVTTE